MSLRPFSGHEERKTAKMEQNEESVSIMFTMTFANPGEIGKLLRLRSSDAKVGGGEREVS